MARGENRVASGRDRTRRRRDARGFGDDRVGGRARRPGLGDERVVGRARGGRRARPRRRHRLRRARLVARRETRVRGARRRIRIVVFPRLSRGSTLAARRRSLFARVGRVGSSRRRGPRRRYRSGVVRGDGRGVRLADASPRGDGIVGGVPPRGVATVLRGGRRRRRGKGVGPRGHDRSRAGIVRSHVTMGRGRGDARVVRAVRSSDRDGDGGAARRRGTRRVSPPRLVRRLGKTVQVVRQPRRARDRVRLEPRDARSRTSHREPRRKRRSLGKTRRRRLRGRRRRRRRRGALHERGAEF